MTVLAAPSHGQTADEVEGLYAVLMRLTSTDPIRLSELLAKVVEECRVDRDEIVAALGDLVEDGGLAYDATARVRHSA